MKTKMFLLIAALTATVAIHAQQISVVSPAGETKIFTDLNLAIQGADTGSTIYLSGGGFHVSDTTKITKKLTIIGIGHRSDNDNADGNTSVSGSFCFEGGSDNSAVMGLWLSDDVNIGTEENGINNFLLRYCNVNRVQVKNSNCQGILINQNYLRGTSQGGNSPVTFSNNILNDIMTVLGGVINHNVIRGHLGMSGTPASAALDCQINNNIIFSTLGWNTPGSTFDSNMSTGTVGGDNANTVVATSWDDVFKGTYSGVNPNDNYDLADGAPGKGKATDGSDIGVYGGTGFSPTALPPGPRIVSKKVADQTDANGNLSVEIKVSVAP